MRANSVTVSGFFFMPAIYHAAGMQAADIRIAARAFSLKVASCFPEREHNSGSSGRTSESEAARTRHRGEAVSGGGGSVFLRQHDRQDTRGHVLVRRVGRAVVEITIVAIDLPEDRLAGILEAAEIVLAVRVVVRREGDEAMNAPHDLDLLLRRHGGNARGDVDAPVSGEGSPERIVQLANSRCRIHTLLM